MALTGIAVGDGGGISIANELSYGSLNATPVWQHAISCGLGPRSNLRPPKQLTTVKATNRDYTVGVADGPCVVGYDESRAVIGPAMAHLGNLDTNDYTIGGGGEPDENSCTILTDLGGFMMAYTGCKATRVRWDFKGDDIVTMTTDWLCRAGDDTTVLTITAPDEDDILMCPDLTPITIGGNSLCVLAGFIQVDIPHIGGPDRVCLGASVPKEPQREWLNHCTAGLTVELSGESGNDTESEIKHYINQTAAGDLVIGDFLLEGCYPTGEVPALGPGITAMNLNYEGQQVIVTTSA